MAQIPGIEVAPLHIEIPPITVPNPIPTPGPELIAAPPGQMPPREFPVTEPNLQDNPGQDLPTREEMNPNTEPAREPDQQVEERGADDRGEGLDDGEGGIAD